MVPVKMVDTRPLWDKIKPFLDICISSVIETARLNLRQWQESDFASFAEMSADPELMRFFPATLSAPESRALAESWQSAIARNGWGVWAVALADSNEFIGITGLQHQPDRFEFSPCTEIAWRIARAHWCNGYASEAAKAALAYGFKQLRLKEIVAFAVPTNTASMRVMQKLGMQEQAQSFYHPELPKNHILSEHRLCRLTRMHWRAGQHSL